MTAEAERKLGLASNEIYRLLLENVLDIVAIVEADGTFVFVNDAIESVLGWARVELNGTNSMALVHPDDLGYIANAVANPDVAQQGHLYQARYRHRDGSWRTLEAMGKRIEANRVIITARDVSARVEAENALRQSRNRLQSVVNNAPIIIWAIDRDGLFTFTDGKGLDDLDSSPGSAIGKSIFDETTRSPEVRHAARRALGGEAFTFLVHEQNHTFSSSYQPLFGDDGAVEGAIGVATDITERWQAERRIHVQASILGALGQGTMAIDREFRVIYWNPSAQKLLGWPQNQVLGEDIREIFPHDSAINAFMSQAAQQVFAGVAWSGEPTIFLRDGTAIPSHIDMTPLRDENHEIIGLVSIVQDISERKKHENALRESEERYALAARGSNAGLWDWDLRSGKVFYSDRWKAMLGFAPNDLSDSPDEWLGRIHVSERTRVRGELDRHLEGELAVFETEYRIEHADGTLRWMMARGEAVRDADGVPTRIAGSQTDATERKVAEEQLLQNAFFDSLTGLPNRALFHDRLDRLISRARRRPDYSFALLFLDLDRFKNVNDSLGHGSGDRLLIEVTRRMERCVRSTDTFARLGGDEFAILLDDVNDISDATNLAERLQAELKSPLSIDGHDIFASVSVGIALSRREVEGDEDTLYQTPEEMLRDADTAMYRAKSAGKARYEIFDRAMHTHAFSVLKLETDLRRAIERDELETHYQPIVHLGSGALTGFEALVRWRHPGRGLVSPAEFIPVAEESGLILPLGEWVLRDVCRQMQSWKTQGLVADCGAMVAVNISSRQFSQPFLVEQVRSVLQEFEIEPCNIKLEITESVIMENQKSAAAMLQELQNLGVQLSIDDFGTGFSSLASLYQFPLSTLKIDRSFIARLGEEGENAEIVRTILALALNLNLNVVAEGIETANQYSLLRALGCDNGQGFLMSRPLVAEDAQKLLAAPPHWWQNAA